MKTDRNFLILYSSPSECAASIEDDGSAVEPSPRKLWNDRNVQTTIECHRLWKACCRLRAVEAGWTPKYEETVRGNDVEVVS